MMVDRVKPENAFRSLIGDSRTQINRRRSTLLFGPKGTPRVAIIGAGFGGIAAGVKLKLAGIDTFRIFEKSTGLGGAWWDNTYPGAAVDTPSHLYSYSFKDYDWTCTHASRAEILKYLEEVVDEFELRPHFSFGVPVQEAAWDETTHKYCIRTGDGQSSWFNVVISAVGLLNVPFYPDWPGLDTFEGPHFHTARWEHEHDLSGKRVAVVGTGSSAAQVVPAIAPIVDRLYVFQREPGWILPKGARDFTPAERQGFKRPMAQKIKRFQLFWQADSDAVNLKRDGSREYRAAREQCIAFIGAVFAGRPDLRLAVTPTYGFWGKRPVRDDEFYPALLRDNVELVPRAVTRLTKTGIVDSLGEEHPVDVVIMATGFHAPNFLATLEVVGRNGRRLHDFWKDDPRAFLGLTVPSFPNFYILYGPNTNGGLVPFNLERQSEFAVRNIKRMITKGVTSIEVRESLMNVYDRWLQSRIQRVSVWSTTKNYFKSASGRVVTNWPERASLYWMMLRTLRVLSSSAERARVPKTIGQLSPRIAPTAESLLTGGGTDPVSRKDVADIDNAAASAGAPSSQSR